MIDDRREQLDLNHLVIESNGKSWERDPYDGLNLEKKNNLWGDDDNPQEAHKVEFTLIKEIYGWA